MKVFRLHCSAAQIQSPGRQMRTINRPGDPECHRGWSGRRLINLSILNSEFLPLLSKKINSIMKMWEMSTAIWWWFYSGLSVLNHIARRHGHVFRMALHNEGDWRMETWQRARRAKCLLAFISYLPMWIKAKYTFIKTVYSPRFYGGPYLQAKHADVCPGVLFWTACANTKLANQVPTSPVKTLVIPTCPMSWSYRCFEWQEG